MMKNIKFIFAPLGVVAGITLWISLAIVVSNKCGGFICEKR